MSVSSNLQYDYYVCVLDFEATCDEPAIPNEIIEYPSIMWGWNFEKQMLTQIGDEFREFVKPKTNPTLTKFCKNLTGITQEQVDGGNPFPEVVQRHYRWVVNTIGKENVDCCSIATCGAWDINTMLPTEFRNYNIYRVPDFYKRFINVKTVFGSITGKYKGFGMKQMLEYMAIPLTGRHHSGIDDTRNISKLILSCIQQGFILQEKFIRSNGFHVPKKYRKEAKCLNIKWDVDLDSAGKVKVVETTELLKRI